jgi:hypothetical protein
MTIRTAPPFPDAVPVCPTQGKNNVEQSRMSPRKFSDRREVLLYRQHFALVWQKFLKANFESPVAVAHAFHVDATTADNWWGGHNAPSGWVVGLALNNELTRDSAQAYLAGDA